MLLILLSALSGTHRIQTSLSAPRMLIRSEGGRNQLDEILNVPSWSGRLAVLGSWKGVLWIILHPFVARQSDSLPLCSMQCECKVSHFSSFFFDSCRLSVSNLISTIAIWNCIIVYLFFLFSLFYDAIGLGRVFNRAHSGYSIQFGQSLGLIYGTSSHLALSYPVCVLATFSPIPLWQRQQKPQTNKKK